MKTTPAGAGRCLRSAGLGLPRRWKAECAFRSARSKIGRSRLVWVGIAALALVGVAGALFRLGPGSSALAAAGPRSLLLLYEGSRFDRGSATHEQMVAEYSAWANGLPGLISGCFIVRAVDMKEAAEIAATCPHLKYGGERRPGPFTA